MSLLDNLGGITRAPNGGGASVLGLIESLIRKAGGLQGLIGTLEKGGLQGAVHSWISSGPNQEISAEQLQKALAGTPLGAHVQEFAQKSGTDSSQLMNQLAQHLPAAVDHLTPNGQVPAGGAELGKLQGLAGRLGL